MIDPNDYWVNNPLITPINKAMMYDNAIWNAKEDEQARIIKLLETWECGNDRCDYCGYENFEWADDKGSYCYTKKRLIALIKGETE